LNDFPHSKQNGLDREVISPQNGHIRVDAKSPRDVFIAMSFPSESARKERKVRSWTRKGSKTEPTLSRFRHAQDDTSKAGILCKIAQLIPELPVRMVTIDSIWVLAAKPK
jgi:hypothetical protein